MAISIGDALLKLGVDTKDLDKGLKGVKNTIQKHHKAIGLAMAAASAVIVGSAIKSVQAYAKMGDEVHKMALRTGFATESLSRFKYALEIGGAELGTLEKGVKKLSMSISDAKDGLATYTREFDKIGVGVEELEGLSPEDQFMKIALAVAAIEDPMERASSAQKLFGRAGTAMLPMLADGAEGLEAMLAEAEQFSPIFGTEASEAAAKLTDIMGQLGGTTNKLKVVIAEALIPTLIPLIEQVRDAAAGFSEWAAEHPGLAQGITILGIALGAGAPLMLGLGFLTTGLKAATGAMVGLTKAVIAFALTPLGALLVGLGMIAAGVTKLIMVQQENEEITKENIRLEELRTKAMAGDSEAMTELILKWQELGHELTYAQEQYLLMAKATGESTGAMDAQTASINQTVTALKELSAVSGVSAAGFGEWRTTTPMEKAWSMAGRAILARTGATGVMTAEWGKLTDVMRKELEGMGTAGSKAWLKEYEVPGYQHGAFPVLKTGLAQVHAGETILPAKTSITIPVILDGEVIATKVVEHLSDAVKLQGGL